MPAGDSSPLRRISEPSLECRGVVQSSKAIPEGLLREIDVHIPFEIAPLEPVQYVHGGVVEGQRDLIRKVPVDFEDDAHSPMENE